MTIEESFAITVKFPNFFLPPVCLGLLEVLLESELPTFFCNFHFMSALYIAFVRTLNLPLNLHWQGAV